MKKALAATGIIILLALAAILIFKYKVGGREEGVIKASGVVEATEMRLGFTLSGKIDKLAVEEGQWVEKGQMIAALDARELYSLAERDKARLKEAQAILERLKAGARIEEIRKAGAAVEQARAELGKARRDLERARSIHESGSMSDSDFDAIKSAFDITKAGFDSAVEQLKLLKAGTRKEDIRAAEYSVAQAREALRASETRLSDAVINSPVDGVVLRKDAEVGEVVGAGMPICTIGDLRRPWIKVYVREERLGLVKLGQRAEVSVDSYPGKVYEGLVERISSEAEFTPKSVQTQEERVKLVFWVKVRVENPEGELKPGMPADVRLLLQ